MEQRRDRVSRVNAELETQIATDTPRVIRCIGAICAMSEKAHRMETIEGKGAMRFLARLWDGWETHREFESYYSAGGLFGNDPPRLDITNPRAVSVYTHEVGLRGRDDPQYGHESYVFASLNELTASRCIEKYTRMLGDFAEIIPMWPDCPL